MPLTFQLRDRTTPGLPVYTLTQAQWRTILATYIKNVDAFQAALVPDTNWHSTPNYDLWMTNASFNPTTSTVANAARKETHRRGDTISFDE